MSRAALLAMLLLVAVLAPGVTAAQSDYELTVDGAESVPDRTVTIEGSDYRVDAISQVRPGEDIVVRVAAPSDDASYRVRLYDSEMNNVATDRGSGSDSTIRFASDCQDCPPGTYMVALYEDGVMLDIHPVVIEGYDVSLTIPDSEPAGGSVTATVEVTDAALSGSPYAVEVALGNGDGEARRVTATHDSGTTYTADVDLDGLDPGTYTVYAGALGEDRIRDSDERESLGISTSHTLSIESRDTSNGGDEGSTGGEGGESDGGTPGTATPTRTATDGNGTTTPTTTPTVTNAGTPGGSGIATSTPTPTDASNVITPNQGTATATEAPATTEDDAPGPPLVAVVAAVLAGGLWWRRRLR